MSIKPDNLSPPESSEMVWVDRLTYRLIQYNVTQYKLHGHTGAPQTCKIYITVLVPAVKTLNVVGDCWLAVPKGCTSMEKVEAMNTIPVNSTVTCSI